MSIEFSPLPAFGFATEPLPTRDGYVWSLTSLLGKLLADAEARFGPRDQSYTLLGMEYHGERPFVWYPGNRKHISILLTDSARENTNRAIFQLAHEVIHLLAPSGGNDANVLEEGLAAINQQLASEEWNLGLELRSPPYLEAARLTNELLRRDNQSIKRLRAIQPAIYQWTPRFLADETGISRRLAEQLTERFSTFEERF